MKPENMAEFAEQWYATDHAGKLLLAKRYEANYDTAKHWVSDNGYTRKPVPLIATIPEPRVNVPTRVRTTGDIKTFAVIGDTHHPFQDDMVVSAMDDFLSEQKPDTIVYNGDMNDFYQVSVFAKDPARLGQLQADIDLTKAMFARHSKALPDADKIFVSGTHENRWIKYLQHQAPAVSKLTATSVPKLYELEKYDIDYVPFEQGLLVNNIFLILHGDIAAAHSSYTAKKHYEKQGGNGICNHTHRGGSYYKRDRFGTWGWWENFCLCRLDPDWLPNPDWVQGFSLVHFNNKDKFWVEQIPIIHGSFIYGGKVYGGKQK